MNSLRPDAIKTSVRFLERHLRRVLEDDGVLVLEQTVAKMESSKHLWRYEIYPEKPLTFKPCNVEETRVQPDIICKIAGKSTGDPSVTEQNVVIRVWSMTQSLSFRQDWDAARVRDSLEKQGYRRVISRYHFDHANQFQPGPKFHLQIGGKPFPPEYCWFPETIPVPRIIHPPIDLILACEIVLANFYPSEFGRLRKEPEWRSIVQTSERYFQKWYYDFCTSRVGGQGISEKDGTLLSLLWNVS